MNKIFNTIKLSLWCAMAVALITFSSCDDYMKGKTFLTSAEGTVDE
jgi:hypothetical protein